MRMLWSAKLQSYAGRSQLIKTVIFGIQTYWTQIFILPKKVVKVIEAVCRSFLWTGNATVSRRSLVAWDRICRPITAGGLNIIDIQIWNKAAITKLLWDLARKKDCLWIKWIHYYYIKSCDIDIMVIPKNASWVVRKIIGCRTPILADNRLQGNLMYRMVGMCKSVKFQIQSLYHTMLPIFPRVEWKNLMVTTNVLPRHKFTTWLAAQGRLPTVDRLLKFGVSVEEQCVFCHQYVEEFGHLYFMCPVTSKLWHRICCWLGYNRTIGSWNIELQWICCLARSKVWQKAMVATAFVTTVSLIWRSRNVIRFEGKSFDEISSAVK